MLENLMPLFYLITGAAATGIVALLQQKQHQAHEIQMHELENKSSRIAEETALEWLRHENWVDRSWEHFRERLGGFTADELWKLLVGVGGIRSIREDGTEWWSLWDRQQEKRDRLIKRKRAHPASS